MGSSDALAVKLLRWYDRCRRDLPWRARAGCAERIDPYHVLVSEAMLQQTQVATVIPYYRRFLERFPTVAHLAQADEQEVLRLWQGLGYYSRARNLQKAAKKIIADHGGKLPSSLEALLSLPGIGRYTAGAVASIAFDQRTPILDGNVTRVLCRLDCIKTDPRDRKTHERLWQRAEEILPRRRVGDFNSALMELGATVCTPRNPQCLLCPVRANCRAFDAGLQASIPAPRKAKPTPLERRRVYCIERDGRWLIERRPDKGRWAGMWQFITRIVALESTPCETKGFTRLGIVRHALTHRRYEFEVFRSQAGLAPLEFETSEPVNPQKWVELDQLGDFPLPRPHQKIAAMLAVGPTSSEQGGKGHLYP